MNVEETKCFLVFGLRRTGNHAIINWICRQNVPAVHLNNCVRGPVGNIIVSETRKFYDADGETYKDKREEPDLSNFKLVVFNFENQPVKDMTFGAKFLRLNAKKVKYIVIARDPYNLFASRLRSSREGHRFIDIWKSHVEMCMNGSDIIGINFNKWFSDKKYRRKLAKDLELDFTDEGIDEVFWYGSSSFDGSRYDGKAQKMRVLERWKDAIGSPVLEEKYRQIVNDPLVRELSKKYFNFPTDGG